MTDRSATRQREMDLWKKYKGGDQSALQPLMGLFRPTVAQWIAQHSSPNVPAVTMRTEALANVKKAIDSYDPSRGAGLNTHVTWGLKKGLRLLHRHSNIARIPEPRGDLIGEYERAKSALTEKLGRTPSIAEIRDYIAADITLDPSKRAKLNLATIARLEHELRRDTPYTDTMSAFAESEGMETPEVVARDLLYSSLAPSDQVIFENAFGYAGKPVLPNVRIAKMVGVSPTTVGKKIRKFQGEYMRLIS